ncbi:MAG: TRAP transporter large permease subunit [Firmicutes bacterium]|nr:TRAP transporter large permease subunit [Bacillota bacterium]
MGPFPLQVFYLFEVLLVVLLFLVLYKRPVYEAMALAYLATIMMTGRYDLFWKYLTYSSTSTLFYAIVAFLLVAHIFGETKVVEKIINFILASVGRFRGGAGYVSLLASTFMAALSGTGPGNVAATGVFTIPAMIETGFSRALAATVEMSCSTLGNIIPPSGIVILSWGLLDKLSPGAISSSQFVIAAYGIGLWFVIQRWLTLLVMCKYYNVKPVPAEARPSLNDSWNKGKWALILPLLIFIPLFLDAKFPGFLTARLGKEGVKAFSTCVLLFTPGMAGAYALWIARRDIPEKMNLNGLVGMFRRSVMQTVPVAATIYLAYGLSMVFREIEMEKAVQQWFLGMGLNASSMIIVAPVFFMLLGMVLPGSSQIALLGSAMIATFASMGGNPVLFASMLPAMTGAMEGMTPPLALCMYAAMGIAKSGFVETTKITLVWVALHLLVSIILLTGVLPIFGL